MATAMGKGHQGAIRSPVRGGIGAFVVAKQMGPDAAPGGAVLENSFMPAFSHGLRRGLKDVAASRLGTMRKTLSAGHPGIGES